MFNFHFMIRYGLKRMKIAFEKFINKVCSFPCHYQIAKCFIAYYVKLELSKEMTELKMCYTHKIFCSIFWKIITYSTKSGSNKNTIWKYERFFFVTYNSKYLPLAVYTYVHVVLSAIKEKRTILS